MTRWSEIDTVKLARHLERKFAAPPDEFRPVPWLCYTGQLATREIYYAIDQMHTQGIRSFFIMPIYGMEVPYLSPRWFQIVKKTVAYCAKRKMTVWIYDDYNWPCGSCAGLLLESHPDFTVRSFKSFWSEKIPPGKTARVSFEGKLWRALAVYDKGGYQNIPVQVSPYKGEIPTEDKRAEWKNHADREARLLVIASCQNLRKWVANIGSLWLKDRKNARGYTDLLNEEASKTFIRMTHAAYYRHLKKYFGRTLKGFFDDEPHLMGVHDNPRFFQAFNKRYGYRLENHLEKLFLPQGKQHYRVRADFRQLAGKLFAGHMRRLNAWCTAHNVDSTGHYLGEERPQAEIAADGAVWPVRKEMSVPGLDLLGCETNYEPVPARQYVENKNHYPPSGLVLNAKVASAAARYLGVPRVMCEAYGCMPYWMAPVDLAIATQWLSGLGTNLMNDNLLALSFEGFRKRALGGRHFTTPWWKYYRDFAEFAGRCSLLAASGRIPAKIGLLYPALTAQCLHEPAALPWQSDDAKLMFATTHACQQTAEALLRGHWDWEIVFEELIEKGRVRNARIKVPRAEFSVLVVPAAHVLAEKVFARLEKFAASGGLLVFTGKAPSISIDPGFNPRRRLKKLLRLANVSVVALAENESWRALRGKLNDIISKNIQPSIKFSGSAEENILAVHRRTAEHEMFHLVNMSSAGVSIQAAFRTNSPLEIWHPDDGRRYAFASSQDGNYRTATLDFAAWEGFFVMTTKPGKTVKITSFPPRIFPNSTWSASGAPTAEWKIKKDRPAMARLKSWARLDPKDEGLSAGWVERKPDVRWTPTQAGALPFNLDPEKSRQVWFKYCFLAQHLPKDLGVVVDNADYREAYLNGMRLAAPRPYPLWDNANLRFNLAGKAKNGWNVLTFRTPVSEYFHKDVVYRVFAPQMTEPVVLTGDFRSYNNTDGSTVIITPRDFLYLGSWNAQDLDGYCGSITYFQEISFERNNRETWLDLGDVQNVAELKINGQFAGRRAWPPYQFRIDAFLKAGQNRFEITVTNGLSGLLGAPGWGFLGKIIAQAPSGLIGPVRILSRRSASD